MKSFKIILMLVAFLFVTVSITAAEKNNAEEKTEIEQTITSFVKSIDSQNADALSKTMVPNGAIVTLNSITNKLDNYSSGQFVDLIKNHQKGGWVRNITVNSVDIDGSTAMAKVEITDARLMQTGYFTLVKEGSNWKVASEVTTLELKKK